MTSTIESTRLPNCTAGTWLIDSDHSEVSLSVRHMMLSKVRDRSTEFSGTVVTAEQITDSSVSADIQLVSITTDNEQRDAHERSPEFLGSDEHPAMTFRSTGIRPDGDSWVITGDLSLKGITHEVELATELLGIGPDAYGGTRAGFSATTSINRKDFDVTWNASIEGGGVVVGDKVDIALDIQAVLQQ